MATELDVLKEIPGYKAILKSVLKSQIQMLMEQLSDQTGEESIILTASVHDGSLSHLGSSTGKGFLEGRDEIKAQFLGYCLKSQHRKESMEAESQQYSRSRTLMPPARRQRPRIRPAPYSISSPGSSTSVTSAPSFPMSSQHAITSMKQGNNINMTLKSETADASDNFLDSVTAEGDNEFPGADDSGLANQAGNPNESFDSSQSSSQDDVGDSVQTVKIEPQGNNNDVEVTGVEMGDNSLSSSDNWGQSYGSSGQNDGNQADQNSYNALWSHSSKGHVLNMDMGTTSSSYLPGANYSGQLQFNRGDYQRHSLDSIIDMRSMEDLSRRSGKGILDTHVSDAIQPTTLISSYSYSCSSCGQKFITKSQYMNHLYDAHNVPHYDCDYCGRRFRMRQQMETHRHTHTGEKPYKCTDCDAAYANAAALSYHKMKIHSGKQ
ncbi:myoneurin-like isoform X2 [Mercenaria mercenaria]|uniref:myoneurin-like isoform X2 n=1 Tax=Mercenaria mercenaria TaxID=6596 RepID=UPI00234EAD38|nr:myoneurin-like isoform X2 [Mercenaria mercenaria]